MSVLDYGRTRVRKSVFRICQIRTKFTNSLASCLLFRKSRSPILLSTPNCSFSHTIFTAAPQQEEAMGVWTTVPEECSLLSFCCSFASLAHCCWDTLSLECRSDHTQNHSSCGALLHTREFSTELETARKETFSTAATSSFFPIGILGRFSSTKQTDQLNS